MTTTRNERRELQGVVLSNKGDKTITVEVERTFKHPKYGKYVRVRKRFMAHDEKEDARPGDTVAITSTRPLSKRKRWRLSQVVERAVLVDEIGGEQ